MNPIVSDIIQGKHDEDLGAIIAAAGGRRKVVAVHKTAVALYNIEVGQNVRLFNVQPRYMIGKIGKVVEKRRTKFVVAFLGEVGRFHDRVVVPANCVEPI